ncbi:nitroreductase family protein [Pollutimonas bauzanensis]|uniref:nitroreductase family protein n=1 Tax=Pollutimonas bauzanensis TaxID=658167 RepID=UPI000934C7A8|nr:nitroreductase family protein [Pollutimonas bauzanensis]
MTETGSGEYRVKEAAEGLRALAWLLTRRSEPLLKEPAPNESELDMILRAAMCAPDHRSLRPWRIALVRGDARAALAQLCRSCFGLRRSSKTAYPDMLRRGLDRGYLRKCK